MNNNHVFRKTWCFYAACLLTAAGGIAGCTTATEEASADKVIASVEDRKLHQSDVEGLTGKGVSAADSASIVNNYVNAWVRKQAMLLKAQKEVKLDEAEIERKIADYRYDLTIYAFEKQYLEQHLDTAVSVAEIETYYKENLANFELKQNIVQGVLVSLPLKANKAERIKRLVQQYDKSKRQELQALCFQHANHYIFTDSSWVDFDELIKNTPFREMPNKTQFLKQNKYTDATDERGMYLLSISDYKIASQTSPLAFASEQIKSIILNKRKVNLIRDLEQQVYKQAQDNNKIKINLN